LEAKQKKGVRAWGLHAKGFATLFCLLLLDLEAKNLYNVFTLSLHKNNLKDKNNVF
jgi:hypothetical protein